MKIPKQAILDSIQEAYDRLTWAAGTLLAAEERVEGLKLNNAAVVVNAVALRLKKQLR